MRPLERLRNLTAGGTNRPGLAVVTGTSSGIGRATAIGLAQRGHRVIAGVRTPGDADSIGSMHPNIEPFLLDITNAEHLDALRTRLEREPAGLQILVNNAGIVGSGPVEVVPMERWEEVLRVNILGTIAVTQVALPAIFRARGRVVNVNSPSGSIAFPMLGPYSVSKFALQALTDTLRREAAPSGVTVTSVSPGFVTTNIFGKGVAEGRDLMSQVHPPELHDRYGRLAVGAIVAGEEALDGNGATPEAAASIVVRAATVRRPKIRYRHGVENQAVRLLAALPDRLGDWLIAQATSGDYTPPPEVIAGQPGPGNLPPSKLESRDARAA